jgi:hypothetical protein
MRYGVSFGGKIMFLNHLKSRRPEAAYGEATIVLILAQQTRTTLLFEDVAHQFLSELLVDCYEVQDPALCGGWVLSWRFNVKNGAWKISAMTIVRTVGGIPIRAVIA